MDLPERFPTVEFVCTLFYLCCQLMKIGLIDVHGPAAMQKETTFVPPGQKRRGINRGFGQEVNGLTNQSPGRVPTRPPHNSVQTYVSCTKRIFSETHFEYLRQKINDG